MVGFVKGLTVGLVSFVAGFAALSVLFPPDELTRAPLVPVADVAEPEAAPAEAAPEGAAPDDAADADVAADDTATPGDAPAPVDEPAGDAVTPGESDTIDARDGATAAELDEALATGDAGAAGQPASDQGQRVPVEPAPTAGDSAPGLDEAPASPPGGQAETVAQAETTVAPTSEPMTEPSTGADGVVVDADAPAARLQPGADSGGGVADEPAPTAPEETAEQAPPPAQDEVGGVEGAEGETVSPDPAETGPAETDPAETDPAESAPSEPAPTEPEAGVAQPPVMRAVPPAPPSPGLERAVEGVVVGRLPTIASPAPASPETANPAISGAGEAEQAALPAWQRFAASHDNPAGLPLFAVIVLDTQRDLATEAALVGMPFKISVALDPADPDAPRRAGIYRSVGHEVLILGAGIPALATPADLEVTFEGWSRALPQAVALLDPPGGGFQSNRQLAQNLMPFLARPGLGLVTLERGLDPAQQSARRAGVVGVGAFRVIDDQDENAATIRRYLDRATFRAQQQGQVAVICHASHAPTLEALLVWRMEGRAGQVSLAPVSALLGRE